MAWPIPGEGIGTPYGKRGSYWSCHEDSNGNGIHTGVDIPCPNGTKIYATIAGDVRHRSYGSAFGNHQFAISPDDDEPFGSGEVFFAHTRTRPADGTRVEIGDYLAEVGSEGNVSGPHLHYEYHTSKGGWNCGVVEDPQPTLDHAAGDSGGGAAPVSAVHTEHIYSNKLGYGEPSNGDESSDSIKELQERLNATSLDGGSEIDITGRYDDATDKEVRLWQEQIAKDPPDPVGESYLGPNQAALMFPSSTYEMHDAGLPAIASGTPAGGGGTDDGPGTTLGEWLKAQGFTVEDSDVPYGRDSAWNGVDFILVHHTVSPDNGSEADIANYIRKGGSGTYPPLAQITLGQSGTVWMCSKQREGQAEPGRASQAGSGNGYGVPEDSMNQYSIGIECQCDGSHPLATHPVLYDTLIKLIVAFINRYDVSVDDVIGHKEWSSTGKTDPRDEMDQIRAAVQVALDGEPTPPPGEATFPPGDVYVSKLKLGQLDSDSVSRLQDTLNHTSTEEADASAFGFEVVLDVTGNYDEDTDTVVRAWQELNDFPPTTYVTVEQAHILFADTGNRVIDDVTEPPPIEPPPVTDGAHTLNGGHCHDIQTAMDTAAAQGKSLRLTGTFYCSTNVYIPDDLVIDATGAKFFVNSEAAAEGATYNAGRFKNANNGDAPGYGAAGWWTWTGGEFDGNGEGIFTLSHSPGFIIQNATFYRYCSTGNTGHAIEVNSSGGDNDLNGPYNVKILNNTFLGTDRGQRSNSNDEPMHWDWNWDGSGAAAPVWKKGDPVNTSTQTMCHNLLIQGNKFHRRSESGGWQFALTAIGGHDAGDSAYDPEYRHNHVLVEGNEIHAAKGSTEVSPNKGAIHLSWTRDAVVKGNKLYGGVSKRYVTAENAKDEDYCSASGNTSSNPTLSSPDKIVVEG